MATSTSSSSSSPSISTSAFSSPSYSYFMEKGVPTEHGGQQDSPASSSQINSGIDESELSSSEGPRIRVVARPAVSQLSAEIKAGLAKVATESLVRRAAANKVTTTLLCDNLYSFYWVSYY
jgi:hypothetical protein